MRLLTKNIMSVMFDKNSNEEFSSEITKAVGDEICVVVNS
jgi:hypothetical protein